MTARSRRLAAEYGVELTGLDLRQQRRLLRRLGRRYVVTPWANPRHDVLSDIRKHLHQSRERTYLDTVGEPFAELGRIFLGAYTGRMPR